MDEQRPSGLKSERWRLSLRGQTSSEAPSSRQTSRSQVTPLPCLVPSPAGGMAEKRGARQSRGRGGTEGRPQPHHLRGPAVGLGELHLRRQQHRGQETQRHRRRGGLR